LEFKRDKYFVDEAETQLREKSLRGSQTQDIHYLEDTASTLKLILTYPDATIVPMTLTRNPLGTLLNQVSYLKRSSMESFTLGLTPKIDFTQIADLQFSLNTLSKHYGILY